MKNFITYEYKNTRRPERMADRYRLTNLMHGWSENRHAYR